MNFKSGAKYKNIKPFEDKVWLASPTMHGEEQEYVNRAFLFNWITTAGENVDEIEKMSAKYVGVSHAVALACGTSALHLAVKLAAEKLYGSSSDISNSNGLGIGGCLYGKRVFCSDMTFDATVNPIVYEGGEPVFIDSEYETWNMDPRVLEKAFELYPDVKLVVLVHLYGTPAKLDEIQEICRKHDALLIEDAAESLGAVYKGRQTGSFGDYNILSFNGNKIITGSTGGMLLVHDEYSANKAKKWSTQSREAAPWYQHKELGYNYRMSNVVAGIIRGQYMHLDEHIKQKKIIYERYREGLQSLPIQMNPYNGRDGEPSFWLSCMLINQDAMCKQVRGEQDAFYISERGKSCPTEILETLAGYNVEGRPIWKPMHMQPIYRMKGFVTKAGRVGTNAYIPGEYVDVGMDIFERGLCLPSDIKMREDEQEIVIEIIKSCFE